LRTAASPSRSQETWSATAATTEFRSILIVSIDKRACAEGWRFLDRAEISLGDYATGRKTQQGRISRAIRRVAVHEFVLETLENLTDQIRAARSTSGASSLTTSTPSCAAVSPARIITRLTPAAA
jgi:hypothetical protein